MRAVLVLHLLAVAAGVLVAAALNGAVFDRYLWPAVLSGAILLVGRYPPVALHKWAVPWTAQVATLLVAGVAAVSLLVTISSDAYDGARWQLGRRAVADGALAATVDVGFEWVGAHSSGTANADANGDVTRPWWVVMVAGPTPCVEVTNSPLDAPGLVLVGTRRWRPLLVAGRASLYEYRRAPACP